MYIAYRHIGIPALSAIGLGGRFVWYKITPLIPTPHCSPPLLNKSTGRMNVVIVLMFVFVNVVIPPKHAPVSFSFLVYKKNLF